MFDLTTKPLSQDMKHLSPCGYCQGKGWVVVKSQSGTNQQMKCTCSGGDSVSRNSFSGLHTK